MPAFTCTLSSRRESRPMRLLRRIGRWLIAGRRAGFVSAHEADATMLAAFEEARRGPPPLHPIPDEVREAYGLWFGGDLNKWL